LLNRWSKTKSCDSS